jgi:hypothetical protein
MNKKLDEFLVLVCSCKDDEDSVKTTRAWFILVNRRLDEWLVLVSSGEDDEDSVIVCWTGDWISRLC